MKLSLAISGMNTEGAFHYINEREKQTIQQIDNISHYLLAGDYAGFPLDIGDLWVDYDVLGMEWDGSNALDYVEVDGVKTENVDFSRVRIIEFPPLTPSQYVFRNTSTLESLDRLLYPYVLRIIGREKGSNVYFGNIDDTAFDASKLSIYLRKYTHYYDGVILMAVVYDGEDMELQCGDVLYNGLTVDIIKSAV